MPSLRCRLRGFGRSVIINAAALLVFAPAATAGTIYTTQSASEITAVSARLNGSSTSTGTIGYTTFNYGLTSGYGSSASGIADGSGQTIP